MDKYTQIIDLIKNDENIRGVVLYGSRANKNVKPDKFQDYDIYYIVNDVDKFDITTFRNVKIMFIPSDNYPEIFEREKCYLMLFDDDSRIDLVVCTKEDFLVKHANEIPMKYLIDKDDNLPGTDLRINEDCFIKPMTEKEFSGTCSEFIWELQNVAKGLKRDELSYAMFIRDIGVRDMLNKIIDQHIGMMNNFEVTVGTLGKYRKKYLMENQYDLYQKTYLSNTTEDKWESIFYMVELFEELGSEIANKNYYHYPKSEIEYMKNYLNRTKKENLL